MLKTLKLPLLSTLVFISMSITYNLPKNPFSINVVKIEWVNDLAGDFGFRHEWSYPEGIYVDEIGQVKCDGLCPHELDNLVDADGLIYKDSIQKYYSLIDTTHLFHSIECEAWTYEYAGTNFITFKENGNGNLRGQTACNIATHSSLQLAIDKQSCAASIYLNSISSEGPTIFPLQSGSIQIDSYYFKKGVVKASFDFKFDNGVNSSDILFWKGNIYAPIEK